MLVLAFFLVKGQTMHNENFRMRRILQGLSQAELARRIGKSMAWISLVERGYLHPTPAMLTAILKALERNDQSDSLPYESERTD